MLCKLNKKGQALIEFVIILPIFLLLVMGVLDFGNILYQKYKLENSVDYITDLYKNKEEEDLAAWSIPTQTRSNIEVIQLQQYKKKGGRRVTFLFV